MGDERLVCEGHERIESLEDGEDDGEAQRDDGEVGLEGSLVRESVSGDSLSLHGPVETDVRSQDGNPGKSSKDGDGRDKVVEDDETICKSKRHVSVLNRLT